MADLGGDFRMNETYPSRRECRTEYLVFSGQIGPDGAARR